MYDHGVIASPIGTAFEMAPPLIATKADLDETVRVAALAIDEVARRTPAHVMARTPFTEPVACRARGRECMPRPRAARVRGSVCSLARARRISDDEMAISRSGPGGPSPHRGNLPRALRGRRRLPGRAATASSARREVAPDRARSVGRAASPRPSGRESGWGERLARISSVTAVYDGPDRSISMVSISSRRAGSASSSMASRSQSLLTIWPVLCGGGRPEPRQRARGQAPHATRARCTDGRCGPGRRFRQGPRCAAARRARHDAPGGRTSSRRSPPGR